MRKTLVVASAAFIALSAIAFAQDAVIIDPSVTNSTAVEIPGEVRTYVLQQFVPSVVYDGDNVIGQALPDTVDLHAVDGYGDYAYAVVNERRVIVNPQTRAVIQVLE